jgi:hydroxypyruvate isomerase
MEYDATVKRRHLLASLAFAGLATGQNSGPAPIPRKGRLKQSCFTRSFPRGMPVEEMCRQAVRLGAAGFDFFPASQWPMLKKYGLTPTIALGGGMTIPQGVVHRENHDELVKSMGAFLGQCSQNGCPGVLISGGERRGISYSEGADNVVTFLNRMKDRAEETGVTLLLEIVNSKYKDPALGRADAVCDHVDWAAEVCTRVNSPRVKILFDIYHVQIMDGDVAANIRAHLPLIGHFHAAGVPGRHEIDETQELNYGFLLKTAADLGYREFVAHEYEPSAGKDPIQTLEKVFQIADV